MAAAELHGEKGGPRAAELMGSHHQMEGRGHAETAIPWQPLDAREEPQRTWRDRPHPLSTTEMRRVNTVGFHTEEDLGIFVRTGKLRRLADDPCQGGRSMKETPDRPRCTPGSFDDGRTFMAVMDDLVGKAALMDGAC